MNKGLLISAIISMVFQAIIALLFLIFVYVPPFGIQQFVANGESLLRKADSLQSSTATTVAGSSQLIRSLLLNCYQILEKLTSFLGVSAIILMACLLVQIVVLVQLKKLAVK